MKLHRFFMPFNYADAEVALHFADLAHQLQKVFRLGNGDRLVLCDGMRNEVVAEITELGKETVRADIIERTVNNNEPLISAALYLAILKRENFELAVQKAVEVGIAEIIPLTTQRTVKSGLNIERLQKIAKEAAEQSGRGIVPQVKNICTFESAVRSAAKQGSVILFDSSGDAIKRAVRKYAHSVGIFIGPEGGFAEEEVLLAKQNNFSIASLGKLTLRAETAAAVASYLIVQG
ncbi:MAG: 16S rRNA (uracil(1498)-N(3))-methyltransferase [Candidatus Sungbacteria bacterium]|nr:16S rRNA (uracil(1498)-N(3))-methyltransferase [Candidatus Sungbacteria bacterium]